MVLMVIMGQFQTHENHPNWLDIIIFSHKKFYFTIFIQFSLSYVFVLGNSMKVILVVIYSLTYWGVGML